MWGLVVFLIGTAYGLSAAGRLPRARFWAGGLLLGAGVGIPVALLGGLDGLGLPAGLAGVLLSAFLLTAGFVVGVWMGGWIDAQGAEDRTVPE